MGFKNCRKESAIFVPFGRNFLSNMCNDELNPWGKMNNDIWLGSIDLSLGTAAPTGDTENENSCIAVLLSMRTT